jgi:hypothetical protein
MKIQLLHCNVKKNFAEEDGDKMPILAMRLLILIAIILFATILGRFSVRVFLNKLLGGSVWWGSFL